MFDGVGDRPGLIDAGASRNGALFRLRRLGLETQKSGAGMKRICFLLCTSCPPLCAYRLYVL